MRAAIVETVPGQAHIGDVEIDSPGLGEVLIRMEASGVCHSDLHALHGHGDVFPSPFVLGHEPAGVVEAIGPGVNNVHARRPRCGLPLGVLRALRQLPHRQVVPLLHRRLPRAPDAPSRLRRGDEDVHQFVGLSSFAEKMLVSQHHLVRIDPALPSSRACLLGCGVLTGIGAALRTAQVTPGAAVAVVGCGGVGLSVIQGARLAYAKRIIAVDVDDAKLDLAGGAVPPTP